jgi:hypothetical protein
LQGKEAFEKSPPIVLATEVSRKQDFMISLFFHGIDKLSVLNVVIFLLPLRRTLNHSIAHCIASLAYNIKITYSYFQLIVSLYKSTLSSQAQTVIMKFDVLIVDDEEVI